MAVQEDVKRESAPGTEDPEAQAPDTPFGAGAPNDKPVEAGAPSDKAEEGHDALSVGAASPMQLGTRRFVYAAYFAGAIAIAFLGSKVFDFAWIKLQSYKPVIGEPRDEVVMPAS